MFSWFKAFFVLQVLRSGSARSHQRSWIGCQNHLTAWGLRSRAQSPLNQRSGSLESSLLQIRGGSNYDDYYDNRGRPNPRGYYTDDSYGKGFNPGDWENDDYGNDPDYYKDDYSRNGRDADPYYDGYDDRGRAPSRPSRSNTVQGSVSSLQRKFRNGDRRIGVPLLAAGLVLTIMGVSLFFNKALMRLGNLMFIAGVPATIGPGRTMGYFLQPKKTRATACLCAGIFLVFVGWPIFGIALEIFGIMNLFGNMFPIFLAVLKNMPIVSSFTRNSGSGRNQSYGYDRDYRDDPYPGDRDDDDDRFY